MASSSEFCGIKYDVFISFRGEDIRCGFLSHLRKELRQKQIDAYVDDRLERGEEISSSLLRAIEESLISLIIFSKDYASSKWCLDELVKIIECMDTHKQIVVPVFYNIDPSDVRHQNGSYALALAKHGTDYTEKVKIWRYVLNKAANLSGFHSKNYGDEVELVEEIGKSLSKRLNIMYQSDLRDLVGIDERIEELELLMCQGSEDVRVIGIWGMGGIGKTTIAAAVFNRFCSEYEGCCFLPNIREESEKHGIIFLKNKILSILLNENDLNIGTPNGIPPYVKRRLLRKKVLVVLDDITDSDQLENLVGALDCFGFGSRIIITTRDKQVFGKRVDKIYEVKPMNFDDAVQLFMLNSFEQNCLDMEWIDLSRRVIDYAHGIPLALKVLGSFLYGKSKEEWESQIEKLNKMPLPKIQHVLRLSYDKLDREEKNIFLYIACFMKGYESQRIIFLLNACGFSTIIGLKVLRDKALISEIKNLASKRTMISMHDLIQEMGWEVVREECFEDPGKRSRLWSPGDIYQVLKDNKGTKAIQSISLYVPKIQELSLVPQVFSEMSELKFLNLVQPYPEEQILSLPQGLETLPNGLRFLHWISYPLKSLPQTFYPESLVELKMPHSRVEKLWEGVLHLVNLRKIDLSNSKHLLQLPDFSMAKNLEEVELYNCRNLREVHPSILSLQKLVRMNLFHCKALTSLKSDVHLRSLQDLFLGECSRLNEFSVTSENMKSLNLSGTAIHALPSSMGNLSKLETFTLDRCKSLKHFPNNLADLRSLRELHIHGCTQLDASNLHILLETTLCLQTLVLEGCHSLSELPHNIVHLSCLHNLLLKGTDITSLPASIKHLPQLEKLDMSGCKKLLSLPELPSSIKEFYATNCTSLQRVEFPSMAAQKLKQNKFKTRFQNCLNLDSHSLRAIGVNAHVNIKIMAYKHLSTLGGGENEIMDSPVDVIYPGSSVPEWFINKTRHATTTIDLCPTSSHSMFMGFIFCVVVAKFQSNDHNFIGCDCYFEMGNNGERMNLGQHMSAWSSIYAYEFDSDHVCLWYDERCCLQTKESVGANDDDDDDDELTNSNQKLSFEFFAQTGTAWDKRDDIVIKECGVCPVYASEYQKFMKQMELELESSQSQQAKAIECSKQPNKYFFPPLPVGTWKVGTKGFKDIFNL